MTAKRPAPGAKPRKKKPAAATRKPEAQTVSAAQLARVLADPPFSDRWLRELSDRGFLVKAGRAQYELAASVQGYIRFVRETEVAAAQDTATSRELYEAERARKLKLENDQREALLVETPDALAAIDHIFGEVRTALAGIAPRLTEDVAERRRIEDGIDIVLNELSTKLDQAGTALQEGRDPLTAGDEDYT